MTEQLLIKRNKKFATQTVFPLDFQTVIFKDEFFIAPLHQLKDFRRYSDVFRIEVVTVKETTVEVVEEPVVVKEEPKVEPVVVVEETKVEEPVKEEVPADAIAFVKEEEPVAPAPKKKRTKKTAE